MLHEAPLQILRDAVLDAKGITLLVKRDDLIHPYVQGNKWRKAKYNLAEAKARGQETLLIFGGAYSNHIYATAAAADLFGFKSIGVIRGERPKKLSSTLQFALDKGMQMHFIDRSAYRDKDNPDFIKGLREKFGDFYLIPEGGTNVLALKGVAEIIDELKEPYDYLCTAVGTGGTLAGLVAGLKGEKKMIGFSSLKGEDTLTGEISKLVEEYSGRSSDNYSINFDYHFGGYAKVEPALIEFIKDFKQKHHIQLEPLYTGKMFYGLLDLIRKDHFRKGSTIVALHTGGLQGLSGFKDYFSELDLSDSS